MSTKLIITFPCSQPLSQWIGVRAWWSPLRRSARWRPRCSTTSAPPAPWSRSWRYTGRSATRSTSSPTDFQISTLSSRYVFQDKSPGIWLALYYLWLGCVSLRDERGCVARNVLIESIHLPSVAQRKRFVGSEHSLHMPLHFWWKWIVNSRNVGVGTIRFCLLFIEYRLDYITRSIQDMIFFVFRLTTTKYFNNMWTEILAHKCPYYGFVCQIDELLKLLRWATRKLTNACTAWTSQLECLWYCRRKISLDILHDSHMLWPTCLTVLVLKRDFDLWVCYWVSQGK